MLPSPTEIQGFIEIAETLNITKAAQRLGIAQPTLSQSLKKLEATIGSQLVIRSKNGVELTIAGKEFVKHAKRLIEQWEQVRASTQKSTQEVRGSIKLGAHPSVALYTLDRFLPELLSTHTGLEVALVHDLSRRILEKVINYEVDLGLVINPIRHADLILHRLLVDEVKIWRAKDAVPRVLLAHPELLQTQDILKKLKRSGTEFTRVITSTNLEVITALALKGAGSAILPSRVVSVFDQKRELKPIISSPTFRDELYLAYRVENRDIKAIQTIKNSIIEAF